MVVDFDPIEIWFFEKCYIRLSTGSYDLKDIKNRFKHLTNNSVNKKAENFVKEEGFLRQEEFRTYIDNQRGEGSFKKIQEQMKQQVIASILAAEDGIVARQNTNSIFGYDFCIDESLKVWLIEVNASPDFSYSSVTFFC